MHRYEACGEYVQKMTADDFVEFVHAITFSEQSISQVYTRLASSSLADEISYARKQLLLSARLSHHNSVRLSVCHRGGSVKSGAS